MGSGQPVAARDGFYAHGAAEPFSSRNQYVARVLQQTGLGTLLFDLLTGEEERVDRATAALRFDIGLLADRMVAVTEWLGGRREAAGLAIGYFGASTGAAAALVAAARLPHVGAVVSRGGRPDLAEPWLSVVTAPTLLVVGGADTAVLGLNRRAFAHLAGTKELVVIPGATHLFEEAGALGKVASLAAGWFGRHLQPVRPR